MNNKRTYFKVTYLTSIAVLLGACSTPPHGNPPGHGALHTGNANSGAMTSPVSATNTINTTAPVTTNTAAPAATNTTSAAAGNNANTANSYIVKKGDTVYEAMRQTGVYWKTIISLNNLQPPYTIHPGQALRLK